MLISVPFKLTSTVDIFNYTCLVKFYRFDNSEGAVLIKVFGIIFAELFDKQLAALLFSFSSNNCHARGIIREDVVDDKQFHGFS